GLMAILLINAVLLLTVVSLRGVPAASPGAGVGNMGTKNGDVNCDGRINIADPVYLLQYLFNRGSDTCVLAQQGPGLQDVIDELKAVEKALTAKWPPRPENIVNLTGEASLGQDTLIFTVPADKWLIVTNLHLNEALTLAGTTDSTTTTKSFQAASRIP